MTVREYYVGDANALQLNGSNGSLADLLKAYLVDGHDVYPAGGWTCPYEFSTVKVLRAGTGNQRFLQVSDNVATYTALCKMIGYENMTAYDTGTNPFPSAGQVADGCRVIKSAISDSSPRLWYLVATEQTFYLFTGPDNDLTMDWSLFAYGDFESFLAGDTNNTILIGRENASSLTTAAEIFHLKNDITTKTTGHFVLRSYTTAGSSIAVGKNMHDLTGMIFPNPTDGGLYCLPIYIHEPTGVLRGRLRGLYWLPQSNLTFNNLDTFDGQGSLAGKTFRMVALHSMNVAVEISNTW